VKLAVFNNATRHGPAVAAVLPRRPVFEHADPESDYVKLAEATAFRVARQTGERGDRRAAAGERPPGPALVSW